MNDLDFHIGQLVIANRILANEGVVDAYGHVSMRHPHHPERYLLSWSRSPELVERTDIMEFTLDGKTVNDDGRAPSLQHCCHSLRLSDEILHDHLAPAICCSETSLFQARKSVTSPACLPSK